MTLIGTIKPNSSTGEPEIYIFPDGSYYKGEFINNFPDGIGARFNKDSNIIESENGYWRKGKFICTIKEREKSPAKYERFFK